MPDPHPAADAFRPTPSLTLELESREALDVREFTVREGLSTLFSIDILAVSKNADIDFATIVGKKASFCAESARSAGRAGTRRWTGICSHLELLQVEEAGVSTYSLTIVPTLWLLSQRRNYRIFQQISEPRIVLSMLEEWSIEPEVRLSLGDYKERKYRVQYAESDYAFVCRMLEEAGITFAFEDPEGDGETKLVLTDAPEKAEPRSPPLPWVSTPNDRLDREFVTRLRTMQQVRPGKYTVRDHDYRRPPEFPLVASAKDGDGLEDRLERFHFVPGAFVVRSDKGDDTPRADDHGKARADIDEGKRIAANRLAAKRGNARVTVFQTSATDVRPGTVFGVTDHPRRELAPDKTLLVTASVLTGSATDAWAHMCEARFTDAPYKPPMKTPKPRTLGVESATVVGPKEEDIHTDEFARVRVHFHWDRQSKRDERSSCWIHVSQSWGGGSFGGVNLPRVGQEVLVDFFNADPDRPVIVGRVFTNLQKVPYPLPEFKRVTTLRTESTPRLVSGGADGGSTKTADSPRGGGKRMSDAELDAALKSKDFRARSPNRAAHKWSGSELTFDDSANGEIAYLQAQRDFNMVVKKSLTTVVGDHRSAMVGSDDVLRVRNKQEIKVGVDREVHVGRDQKHIVERNITQTSKTGSQEFVSEIQFHSYAKKRHYFESDDLIILRVGTSSITLGPTSIVIQAESTFINPGGEWGASAMEGQPPLTQQQLDAMAKKAATERADAARRAKERAEAQKTEQRRQGLAKQALEMAQRESKRAQKPGRPENESELRARWERVMRHQGPWSGVDVPKDAAELDRLYRGAQTGNWNPLL